jgi:hypothetical protein
MILKILHSKIIVLTCLLFLTHSCHLAFDGLIYTYNQLLLTDPDSSYEIPVIVVATVAAVLVIAIAAFFLVKVGNFCRKYIKGIVQ